MGKKIVFVWNSKDGSNSKQQHNPRKEGLESKKWNHCRKTSNKKMKKREQKIMRTKLKGRLNSALEFPLFLILCVFFQTFIMIYMICHLYFISFTFYAPELLVFSFFKKCSDCSMNIVSNIGFFLWIAAIFLLCYSNSTPVQTACKEYFVSDWKISKTWDISKDVKAYFVNIYALFDSTN